MCSPPAAQVFVRVRPESDDALRLSKGYSPATPATRHPTSSLSSPKALAGDVTRCVAQVDDKTVRIMPSEGALGSRKAVAAVDDKIFSFDKVLPEDATQEDVYRSVSAHVKATVRGYNTTIFAYGSTGSGKSHTMTGNSTAPGIIPRAISEIFSIIEATAAEESDVFFYVRLSYVELYNNNFRNLLEFASKELAAKERAAEREEAAAGSSSSGADGEGGGGGRARSSSPTQMHPGLAQRTDKIEVRESQSAGVFLAGPNLRIPVTTAQEAFQLIAKGNRARAVGSTQCNDVSSRSHAILTLHVESRVSATSAQHSSHSPRNPNDVSAFGADFDHTDFAPSTPGGAGAELRLGKMHLVDLAGSERVGLSGAEGDTLVETQNINLSLTAIGDVLSALSRNAMVMSQQQQHLMALQQQQQGKGGGSSARPPSPTRTPKGPLSLVPVPYRNSKLTHLLKDSLGGNSKTIMIATIRTGAEYYQQTAVTLMYASRAKKIKNRSLVNRNIIGDTGIHAVTKEIERLRARLDERSSEFEMLRHTQLKDASENEALKERLRQLKEANEREKKELELQVRAPLPYLPYLPHASFSASRTPLSLALGRQMSNIIHSQAGQLAKQNEKISTLQQSLQEELTTAQARIADQVKTAVHLVTMMMRPMLTHDVVLSPYHSAAAAAATCVGSRDPLLEAGAGRDDAGQAAAHRADGAHAKGLLTRCDRPCSPWPLPHLPLRPYFPTGDGRVADAGHGHAAGAGRRAEGGGRAADAGRGAGGGGAAGGGGLGAPARGPRPGASPPGHKRRCPPRRTEP